MRHPGRSDMARAPALRLCRWHGVGGGYPGSRQLRRGPRPRFEPRHHRRPRHLGRSARQLQHLYTFTNLTPAASMRLVSEGDLKAMRERRRRGLPDLHRGMVQHGARPPPAPPNPGPHAGFGFQGGYPLLAPGAPAPMGDGDPNAERIPIAGAAVGGGLGALEAALLHGGLPLPGGGPGGGGAAGGDGGGAQQLARIVGDNGGAAAAAAVAPSADDARTLPILIGDDGVRFREFRDGVRMLQESAWSDWPGLFADRGRSAGCSPSCATARAPLPLTTLGGERCAGCSRRTRA